jgi:hypothetical protein
VGKVVTHRDGYMTRRKQTNKPRQPKMPFKKDRAWFEARIAELKTALEKLPADRQEQLKRKLESGDKPRRPGKAGV